MMPRMSAPASRSFATCQAITYRVWAAQLGIETLALGGRLADRFALLDEADLTVGGHDPLPLAVVYSPDGRHIAYLRRMSPSADAKQLREDMAKNPEDRQLVELIMSGTQLGRPEGLTGSVTAATGSSRSSPPAMTARSAIARRTSISICVAGRTGRSPRCTSPRTRKEMPATCSIVPLARRPARPWRRAIPPIGTNIAGTSC